MATFKPYVDKKGRKPKGVFEAKTSKGSFRFKEGRKPTLTFYEKTAGSWNERNKLSFVAVPCADLDEAEKLMRKSGWQSKAVEGGILLRSASTLSTTTDKFTVHAGKKSKHKKAKNKRKRKKGRELNGREAQKIDYKVAYDEGHDEPFFVDSEDGDVGVFGDSGFMYNSPGSERAAERSADEMNKKYQEWAAGQEKKGKKRRHAGALSMVTAKFERVANRSNDA